MNDQDEMFEAATELPAVMGCPSLGPKTLPSGFDGVEPGEDKKAAKHAAYNRRTWTFCDGLFPIIYVDTPEGFMATCKINGRTFKESVTQEDGVDGKCWTGYIYDKNVCVCMIGSMGKGKNATKLMTHAAFRAYIKQLSGSGKKYHNRKGFLRKSVERTKAAAVKSNATRKAIKKGGAK